MRRDLILGLAASVGVISGCAATTSPVCGNGIVESGEQCDAGSANRTGGPCGSDCRYLDACSVANGGCDPLTACTSAIGLASCGSCPSGYSGTGATGCVDVDECLTDNGGCGPQVTCINTVGSHRCNTLPEVVADVALTDSASVTVDALANDSDADGDALTVVAVGDAVLGGTASIEPDGRITFVPAADYAGADAFEYTVSDGLDTATGTVFVETASAATGATTRIATWQSFGGWDRGAALSANGDLVAYAASNVANDYTVYLLDRSTDTTSVVSAGLGATQPDDSSEDPAVSANGEIIAFASFATNLVEGDTNGAWDVFIYDVSTGALERLPVGGAGQVAVSANGKVVAFISAASGIVPGKTTAYQDAYVYDRDTGLYERVSLGTDGTEPDGDCYAPSLSADGSLVAFSSDAANLAGTNHLDHIYVHDRRASTTTLAVNGDSTYSALSYDGRTLVYDGFDFTAGAVEVRALDLRTGMVTPVSVKPDGTLASQSSHSPSVSADGRFVAFTSEAADLVAGDTNGVTDVFVRDLWLGVTIRVSVTDGGTQADGKSSSGTISADGRFVTFRSMATNLPGGAPTFGASTFMKPIVWP